MFFSFKSKKQIAAAAQSELRINLTLKALQWFKKEIERGSSIEDFDIKIISALQLARELDLISGSIYRELQKEAETASTKGE